MRETTTPRTYSSWIFIAAFVVLAAVGIVSFISGGGVTGTETLDTPPATAAVGDGDDAADSIDNTGNGEDAASSSGPGDVPEGASVQRDGAASSYTFPAPESLSGPDRELRVEIASATAAAIDSGLTVTTSCTHSADEHLGQVVVNEGSNVVTVVPLIIVPADGGPCIGDSAGNEMNFELSAPIGSRSVVVVPVGTPIPEGTNMLGT